MNVEQIGRAAESSDTSVDGGLEVVRIIVRAARHLLVLDELHSANLRREEDLLALLGLLSEVAADVAFRQAPAVCGVSSAASMPRAKVGAVPERRADRNEMIEELESFLFG